MITAVLIPNRPVPYLNIGHRVCLYALLTGETVSVSNVSHQGYGYSFRGGNSVKLFAILWILRIKNGRR